MKTYRDSGFWILLLVNLGLLIRFLFFNMPIESVMMAYWIQSVIIGLFNTARILLYPTQNITSPPEISLRKKSRNFTGVFFFFHFMGFHLAYLFLLVVTVGSPNMFHGFWLTVGGFLFAGLVEFINDRKADKGTNPPFSVGGLMFMPYLRIIPMHLFIAGPHWLGWSHGAMFLALKIPVDILLYLIMAGRMRKTHKISGI